MAETKDSEVPKRIDEVLLTAMKQNARAQCMDEARAYAECCRGRTISMVWKWYAVVHVVLALWRFASGARTVR